MASRPWFDRRRGEWLMKYRPDPGGKWIRVSLGKHPGEWHPSRPPRKPPQAIVDRHAAFAEVEYRARHQMGPAPARARPLAGYMAEYLEAYRATHDAGSARQLDRHIRTFLEFAAPRGVTTIQAVTKATCRDFMEERVKTITPNSVRTEKGYLSPIWSRAVDDGLVQVNPWSQAKAPGKKTKPEPTFWTGEQVTAIAGACARPWQSDLVLVLANTGIRISAALAMRWAWIDWGKGTVTVPREESKSGHAYSVALNGVARGVLERRCGQAKDEDLVFPNPVRGGAVPYGSARAAIQRAIGRARVPRGTPHDLRHSYGRALERAGVPLAIIQAQLGHSSISMTERYVSAVEDEARRYVEGFGLGADDA